MAPVPLLYNVTSVIKRWEAIMPLYLNCVVNGAQPDEGDAVGERVIGGDAKTVTVAVLEHPAVDVPVTVYVVVVTGLAFTV